MDRKVKSRPIWQPGDLFHAFSRYPRKADAPRVDRLAGVLRKGLVAPALCNDGSVRSDLNIEITGASVPYDSLVFLHRFGEQSWLYTISEPGRIVVFVDPTIEVLTPEDLAPNWVVLCRDEVYVKDGIPVERLTGVAVHPADADSVLEELSGELSRLSVPLYLWDGTTVWPPS